MALSRWDPFGEITSLRQAMDRLLEDSFVRSGRGYDGGEGGVALDVMEKDDAFVVKASLPGVKPDDVDITVHNNVLTISGEAREERESGQGRYHRRERRFGRFTRSVMLPNEVNSNTCDARFEDGVLTVTLPKSEQARPKRIQIAGGQRQAVEAPKAGEASKASASAEATRSGTSGNGNSGAAREARTTGSNR